MNRQELINQIKEKRSFLCVGLDSDIKKLPAHLLGCEDPIFEFNKAIIDPYFPRKRRRSRRLEADRNPRSEARAYQEREARAGSR